MVSTSKILTVSYGTFSCTLEGFDDSFDTMKAIAEYFRDLAADDRYFGAEPPTPDADMLARIAEKEIARRVEAHEDEGKIHLRAKETPAIAAPADAAPAEAAPVEASPVAATPEAEAQDAPAPEMAEDAPVQEAPVQEAVLADTVAEDAVAEDAVAEDAVAEELPTNNDSVDTVAASIETAMAEANEVLEDTDTPKEETPPLEEPTLETPVVEEPTFEETTLEEPTAEDDPDDDSVAARLRRIRSVVASGTTDFEPTGFSEDEHAQDFLGDTVSNLDAALMADAPEAQEMPERVTSQVLHEDTHNDALEAISAQLAKDAEPDTQSDTDFDADFDADLNNDIENLTEDTLSQLLADAIPEESDALDTDIDAFDDEHEVEQDAPVSTPLRARVIKMKRSDFEAAVADGALEETFDVLQEDAFDDEPAEAILSPEDEADLQSELDAVTAELEADPEATAQSLEDIEDTYKAAESEAFGDTFEDHAPADETSDDSLEDDTLETDTLETDEQSTAFEDEMPAKSRLLGDTERPVSRLFDEAETHLDAPEASRRRSAIQHLRAAVEANEAEADAGSELRPGADDGIYRSDIADVMRNNDAEDTVEAQRADGSAAARSRSRRPIETRPAPLKLVAEQRVDMPRDPVRPRRVSTAHSSEPVELPQDVDSFSEFAEDIGANNLPELLEAAAAYMADVEGRVQFSRPMLMGKLKEATAEDFSREDSLKSFGQLLRNGKLQKLKGGRFTVTEETEFRAKTRNAG